MKCADCRNSGLCDYHNPQTCPGEKMHGGKRKGAGPPKGKRTDNVKMGISISRKNAEWLKAKKSHGFNISRLIDKAIDLLRGRED